MLRPKHMSQPTLELPPRKRAKLGAKQREASPPMLPAAWQACSWPAWPARVLDPGSMTCHAAGQQPSSLCLRLAALRRMCRPQGSTQGYAGRQVLPWLPRIKCAACCSEARVAAQPRLLPGRDSGWLAEWDGEVSRAGAHTVQRIGSMERVFCSQSLASPLPGPRAQAQPPGAVPHCAVDAVSPWCTAVRQQAVLDLQCQC